MTRYSETVIPALLFAALAVSSPTHAQETKPTVTAAQIAAGLSSSKT